MSSKRQPNIYKRLCPVMTLLCFEAKVPCLSKPEYRMMKVEHQDQDNPQFVEFDPTGRYGRFSEILGKGSSKIVYRAFDEYEGIEVAWNQVKLNGFLQSPQDMERLYCEIHLLKTLKHKHIMKFYTSWVDIPNRNINFVTELFTSGTLRQYRQKYKRVQIRAVKHWCRQILKGLLYLHSYNPPIIHRDLKCDNIFINGNQGVVKIGDLGLAAIHRKSHVAHCVGTPEFMAPEVYKEEYNELVDIYSFGMCVLEMVTSEYPYSECTHPAQIYKKVISGTKPEALSRIEDPEVRQFVEKCLVKASRRLSARELLNDPFLRDVDHGLGSWEGDIKEMCHILGQPPYQVWDNVSCVANEFDDKLQQKIKMDNAPVYSDSEKSHILLHPSAPNSSNVDEPSETVDITIKGTRGKDGSIFLKLRITDKEGHIRHIHFPFDIKTDTAFDVATEMVNELEIADYGATRIANMINGEVYSLIPEWKPSLSKAVPSLHTTFCDNCPTYQLEGFSEGSLTNEASVISTIEPEVLDISYHASRGSHSDEEDGRCHGSDNNQKENHPNHPDNKMHIDTRECVHTLHSDSIKHPSVESSKSRFYCPSEISNSYENKLNQELRRLKSEHQMEQKDSQQQLVGKIQNPPPEYDDQRDSDGGAVSSTKASGEKCKPFQFAKRFSFRTAPRRDLLKTSERLSDIDRGCSSNRDSGARSDRFCEWPGSQFGEVNPGSGIDNMFPSKRYPVGFHLPNSLL